MGSSALRKEFFVWIAIVWPVLITNISQTGMGLTDISFLGHYNRADPLDNSTSVSKSTTYVSAASLGNIYNSLMNVLIVKGINSAGQILISQALGAKNFRLAKSYLYVCLCLVTLFGMPIVLSYIWAGQILDYFSGLGEELTALTTSYTRTLAVGFIPFLWYQAFNSYLVSNHVTMPQMVLSMACFCLNLLFNALFLYGWGPDWAGFGFIGSPMATVGSRCVLCIGGFAIVRHLMSKHKKAQIPLSDMSESPPQAIEDGACTGITIERMKKLLLLGLPLSLSMLLEDGQLQFIAILAARIGKISIATHNSMLNFVWVLTSMMWAVSGATRVRVAFYLGAGNVEGAKRVIKIASVCGGGIGTLIALTFIVLRVEIGHLFSNDPLVWHLATKISTLCGLGYLALVIFYINMATLGAQGRPMAIALSFVLGAWVCCIPLAFFFAFHLEQTKGLFGLWLALAFGYGITTTLSSLYVWKSDWAGIVRRVQNDAEVNNTTINHDNQEYVPLESGDDERHGRYGST